MLLRVHEQQSLRLGGTFEICNWSVFLIKRQVLFYVFYMLNDLYVYVNSIMLNFKHLCMNSMLSELHMCCIHKAY
jgi:hypothetical protein